MGLLIYILIKGELFKRGYLICFLWDITSEI